MAIVEFIAMFSFLFILYSWFMIKQTEWPILGMLPALILNTSKLNDFTAHNLNMRKHTSEFRGPWFSRFNFIVTSDPENIHYILSSKFANFAKGSDFKEIFDVLGDGIIAAESKTWKMQRKLIHSLFRRTDFLKMVETTINEKLETGLFNILDYASDNGLEMDLQDLFLRLSLDVTCKFLLGADLNSLSLDLPEVPFAKALDDNGELLLCRHLKPKSLWKLQKWLQVGMEKKAENTIKTIDSFIYEHISLSHEQNTKNIGMGRHKEESFDLISKLVTEEVVAECPSSAKPVETFLRDIAMSIIFAGRDTSAIALTWFFWLVSTYPLVESKIREEIQVTFQMKPGDPWIFPSYSKLNELIYLHAALCETLRLYPSVPFNVKESVKQDILPTGHHVEQGTKVLISIYTMGRMEKIWGADCCEFKPERWISEKKTILDMPPFKFNAFSSGPRICVGKDLAFREMKSVAAAVIWSYNIRVKKDHPVIPAMSIALLMKHGLKVNVAKNGEF